MRRGIRLLTLNVATTFLVASFAFAAASEHGEGHHAPSFGDLKYYLINFAIYLALVLWVISKTAPAGWRSRRQRIQEMLQTSRAKVSAADQAYQSARQRLEGVDEDVRSLSDLMKVEAQREAEEIIRAAKAQAARIVKQAHDNAEAERKVSESAIRKEYAAQALKIAEERLRKEITPERDKSMRVAFHDSVKTLLH